ncbi:ribonuclease BN [Halobacteriales archaeon QS_8_69_73]|nr:MAG: ribonuclease BN [Halobacteriales archaeon QS_8_69_73]
MASLTEVYDGGGGAGLRRVYAGVVLFVVGAVLLVAGIATATTDVGGRFGLGLYEAREVAGVLGGVGLPLVLLGTMTAIPRTSRRLRGVAVVGAAASAAGVALFADAYPVDWVGGLGDTTMTLVVASVYFIGTIVTTWCLFVAVANFKARNDPGGTVKLEITKAGETRVVEVSNDRLEGTLGGIGVFGGTPDGDVETQTNRGGSGRAAGNSQSITDGGATTDDAEFLADESASPLGDTYCGNCTHFRYVRTDDGMVPYCGYHDDRMDDMEACEEWTSNTNTQAGR